MATMSAQRPAKKKSSKARSKLSSSRSSTSALQVSEEKPEPSDSGKTAEGPVEPPSEKDTEAVAANCYKAGKTAEGPVEPPSEKYAGTSTANCYKAGKTAEGPVEPPSEKYAGTSTANCLKAGKTAEGPVELPSEKYAGTSTANCYKDFEEAGAFSYDEEFVPFRSELLSSDSSATNLLLQDEAAAVFSDEGLDRLSTAPTLTLQDEAAAVFSDEGLDRLSTAPTLTLQDEDDFQDAIDEYTHKQPIFMDLQASFDDCNVAIQKFFDNDIPGAMAIMEPWAHVSLYHSLGMAIFHFIPAMLTFDKGQLMKATKAIKNCIQLCNKHRKTLGFAQTLGSVVKKQKYADFTDMEAHSELCYAEALLLQAALTVADGEDYSSYVSGIFKIRSCYSSYKLCWQIKECKNWKTEQSKIHFDSGVRLGTATFNLMVSLLPPRIISLLEFVGFSGSRIYGITELERGARSPGMRAVLCDLTLLIYYLIVIPFIGGQGNIDAAELIFQKILVTYPNSVWFLALRARSEFLKGRLQHAINAYKRAIIGQENFRQFRILCYWELMWVHGLNLDFEESAMYAELLVGESAWSKTTQLYVKAAMLMQLDKRDLTNTHRETIDNAMRLAPLAKVRIAGKSLPMEKFITKRCERYKRQGKRLILPAFELLNLWNMLHCLTQNKDHLAMILRTIEKTLAAMEEESKDWMGDYVNDNFALVHYLRGCALSAMQLPRQASQELQRVIDLKKLLKEDTFLVPYAVCEMAMCYFQMGNMQAAMEMLNDVKKKYSGYTLETRLHIRVHARVEVVRSVIGASKFTPGIPGIQIQKHYDG